MTVIGILHPGAMGAAVAGQLNAAGHRVLWVPDGRSATTKNRAQAIGLLGVGLDDLLEQAEVILSICPPAAAEDVALTAGRFTRVWVEANAIAPERTKVISRVLPEAAYVDGAIIGSPPAPGKQTTLYLAGPRHDTAAVRDLFRGTMVEARVLPGDIGQASALKMAYSSFQKTSRVLAAVAYAAAVDHGVEEELLQVAARRDGSYLQETGYVSKTAARAWRWGPELREVADTLKATGLPPDLAEAASRILGYWPRLTNDQAPELNVALQQLHAEVPPGE